MSATNKPKPARGPVDPYQIYFEAHCHLLASQETTKAWIATLDMRYTFPSLLLRSFSLELFLKCLHCMYSGKPAHGHPLETLFKGLPKTCRDRITKYFDETFMLGRAAQIATFIGTNQQSISTVLADITDLFVESRYRFEGTDWPQTNGLDDVLLAVIRLIDEEHPDWKSQFQTSSWGPGKLPDTEQITESLGI